MKKPFAQYGLFLVSRSNSCGDILGDVLMQAVCGDRTQATQARYAILPGHNFGYNLAWPFACIAWLARL